MNTNMTLSRDEDCRFRTLNSSSNHSQPYDRQRYPSLDECSVSPNTIVPSSNSSACFRTIDVEIARDRYDFPTRIPSVTETESQTSDSDRERLEYDAFESRTPTMLVSQGYFSYHEVECYPPRHVHPSSSNEGNEYSSHYCTPSGSHRYDAPYESSAHRFDRWSDHCHARAPELFSMNSHNSHNFSLSNGSWHTCPTDRSYSHQQRMMPPMTHSVQSKKSSRPSIPSAANIASNRRMVEIGPGSYVALRGAEEVWLTTFSLLLFEDDCLLDVAKAASTYNAIILTIAVIIAFLFMFP
jgi:hypothetical protein